MKPVELRVAAAVWDALQAYHLDPDKRVEALSYVLAGIEETDDAIRILVPHTAPVFRFGAMNENRFPWNDRYVATAEPGHKVEVTMAGTAGEQFMARTATAILIGQTSDLPEPRPARGETFTFEPTPWKRP